MNVNSGPINDRALAENACFGPHRRVLSTQTRLEMSQCLPERYRQMLKL